MIKIIAYNENHLSDLKKIYLQERRRTFIWVDQSKFKLIDFERETKGEYILTAVENDKIIGFISVWMPNNFIHHLYVAAKNQGSGVGTQLLNAVVDKIGFPITLKCLENNIQAVHFYIKKGFKQKERGFSVNGGYILFELTESV
jgi:ribosomal protein S18 acetylase RimI-like enzyme